MHETCGAASWPSLRISSTVERVPSRVDPPAPKVTEKNAGFSCASCLRVARSFSIPSGDFGGNNSKLKSFGRSIWVFIARIPRPKNREALPSVPVGIRLIGPGLVDADVLRLVFAKLGELRIQLLQ